MENIKQQSDYFSREKISKILLKMATPVMLAQLIQALYKYIIFTTTELGSVDLAVAVVNEAVPFVK